MEEWTIFKLTRNAIKTAGRRLNCCHSGGGRSEYTIAVEENVRLTVMLESAQAACRTVSEELAESRAEVIRLRAELDKVDGSYRNGLEAEEDGRKSAEELGKTDGQPNLPPPSQGCWFCAVLPAANPAE